MTVGRVLLVSRLALRDLRRRRAEAVLLLLAILAATTTLTLGLVLHGVTDDPYQATREVLADELGIDPGPELRRLEGAVLAQDPELDAAPATAPPRHHPGDGHRNGHRRLILGSSAAWTISVIRKISETRSARAKVRP